MPTACIETTIPSYYTARNARSILQAGRQLATREWWDAGCSGFDLVTSTETLNEAGEGDLEMAKERLALLRGIPILPVTEAAAGLARMLVAQGWCRQSPLRMPFTSRLHPHTASTSL